MKRALKRCTAFVRRHIATIAFFVGFATDSLTLTRIDLVYENVVFVSYLSIALAAIILLHAIDTRRMQGRFARAAAPWLPAAVQFPLGGLFSGMVIFYTKSAAFFTSWPFIVLLVTLLVGNEFLRRRYERLTFQIGIFFLALYLYLILVVPMLIGEVSTMTFVLAGLVALTFVSVVIQALMWLFPELYARSKRGILLSVVGIYIGCNVLYATNVIPPVPLALQSMGIYHSVALVGNTYRVSYEPAAPLAWWRDTAPVFHRTAHASAYCFASVFAPVKITATIYHSWQYMGANGAWIRVERIAYPIVGGRDGGYRGYTIKSNLPDGRWRCVVETENGKVIGETRFTVQTSDTLPALKTGEL